MPSKAPLYLTLRLVDLRFGLHIERVLRHGDIGIMTFKKTAHANEQDRPDVSARGQAWCATQAELDPRRLVFINETGASTKMAWLYRRSPRGTRCLAATPHGHWKTTTFVGGLRLDGMTAPMVLDACDRNLL